jgi:hypothetical protein
MTRLFGRPAATVTALLVAALSSCGGKTVVEPAGGGGTAGASSTSSSGTTSSSTSSSGTTSSSTSSSGTTSSSTSSSGTSSTSSSGTGGGPSWTCPQLQEQYGQQLELGRVCHPEMSTLQCTLLIDDQLGCPCPTFVNPKNAAAVAELEQLHAAWTAQGCDETVDCPGMPCPMPKGAFCEPQPDSSKVPGLCKDSF